VDVTFDYNGGHKPASLFSGPVVKTVPAGTWVVLIDAPVREDADFLYWESDCDDVTVSKPGQNFCAMEPVVFTAVWSDELPAEGDAEAAPAEVMTEEQAVPAAEYDALPDQEEAAAVADEEAVTEAEAAVADKKAAVSEEEEPAVPEKNADTASEETPVLSLAGGESASVLNLADFLSGDGSDMNAKLVIDIGGGNAIEIPVNIQVSLGTPVLVSSAQ
jgi:hypothetical protein